ncbi:ABC transporter substrate-binding protein [Desulfovibrio sp. JC010]|uniref:substrate-binding periplasmic protein n=1 Tax=Desulfovibrio sp. JC010 TaxID=2593641 RepID=UPI0013D535C6|nr:transporter substrate-binding domain-containing protein [Desulfovibrio sp. JC010]NDV25259.1 amino acid ABC transporter substrate-binding protein [Desulfovibrio sp. JC010]
MKKILTLISAIFLLTASVSIGLAQEVIVPVNHYPPWRIVKDSENISGINIELMDALLRKLDLKAQYVVRPWKRAQLMMKRGTADIMNGLLKHHDRELYMTYLEPPYKTKSSKAFFILKNSSTKIDVYEDLYKYRIGVTLGSKFFPKFDHDEMLQKDMGLDATGNFKKLNAGHIDALITTETVGDYLLHKLGFQDRIAKADYVYSEPLNVYFAVSQKSPLAARIPELNAALKEMVESGEAQGIIDHFQFRSDETKLD